MLRASDKHHVKEIHFEDPLPVKPKKAYLSALKNLARDAAPIEALFDHFGHVRTISFTDSGKIFNFARSSTPAEQARAAISSAGIVRALGLKFVDLIESDVVELPGLGHRVDFKQVLNFPEEGIKYLVRGGSVQVFLDTKGAVFQINSTVRRGRRPADLDNIISSDDAIAAARAAFGEEHSFNEKLALKFSSHNGRLDPVYEVTLSTDVPRKVVTFLVKATTGEVVHSVNDLRASQPEEVAKNAFRKRRTGSQTPVPGTVPGAVTLNGSSSGVAPAGGAARTNVAGRGFLQVPDPNKPLPQQVYDIIVESLPDPKELKNHNLAVYLGSAKRSARCKVDGTFNYKPGDPEFAATITFFAVHAHLELFKSWGLRVPGRPIDVHVNDRNVSDNAYFDPLNNEIRLGVGSGLPNGLNVIIAHDIGVVLHEGGHYVVMLQTPGQDLPGREGGAIHEAIGDMCTLLMNFWFRFKYGSVLGHTLTVQDVDNDPRIIGAYVFPPYGIRIQKNKKRTPRDKTGDPHDDGLIVGGALADLLVAMALRANVAVEKSLEDFGRLMLAALALVPSHKVTFVDLLKAFHTADQQLFNSANQALITKAFNDHGIVLPQKGRRGRSRSVVIIFD